MSEDFLDSVRVIGKAEAIKIANVSLRTWDRMEAAGETPPKTQLSERRIGYRIVDLRAWLDRRRLAPGT
jgi:hypothetical protein